MYAEPAGEFDQDAHGLAEYSRGSASNSDRSITSIAKLLGISPDTLYNQIPYLRGAARGRSRHYVTGRDVVTGPSEGQERWQPPARAWRYGDIWDFAERLADALALDDEVDVWVWPEDAEGPDVPPDYAVFDLAERTEAGTNVSALLWEAGQGWRFTLEAFHGAHTVATLKTAYLWQPVEGAEESGDEQVVFAAAAAVCRAHPRSPRFHVHAGPVESWDWMVEALIAAGARSHGGRYFEVRPPLSAQQVDALRRLDRGDTGVAVTGEPPGADLWRVDPAAPDPDCDYDSYAWWKWQLAGGNPDERPAHHGAGGNGP